MAISIYDKIKYNTAYNKNNYDRCIFNVPIGYKQVITKYYQDKGYKSLNAYINTLIHNDMMSNQTPTKIESDLLAKFKCCDCTSQQAILTLADTLKKNQYQKNKN